MEKFLVCRDDSLYLAFPDVARAHDSERLICVFSECTHHGDRSHTRIVFCVSDDRGRTWTPRRPLSDALQKRDDDDPHWNCARITALADGRLAVVADRVAGPGEGYTGAREQTNWLWFSGDAGETWTGPHPTPVRGIVPDRLIELGRGAHAGRWILAAHTRQPPENDGNEPLWTERCWLSDDRGQIWRGPIRIAARPDLKLCEGSVLELPGGELVCFLRENSGRGLDAFKVVSRDGGETWDGPTSFPLPGCHRPVAGMLRGGRVLITHRFSQGGGGWLGWWTQNLFAALTDAPSCLAPDRKGAHTRIFPLDFDRSSQSDTGYSGWVQFDDGEIIVVNYIVDDAPRAQIRGTSLRESDLLLPAPGDGPD